MQKQLTFPWIAGKKTDSFFILAPAYYSIALAFLLSFIISPSESLTLIPWVIFVLLIDVGHVYGSLYRTYLNPLELEKNYSLLLFVPIACYTIALVLYNLGPLYFWRALAYLAVFHFIRQQYGIMRIYSRNENECPKFFKTIDTATIYLATLYPISYWHTNLPRNFSWFVENDFFLNIPFQTTTIVGWLYSISILIFISKNIYSFKNKILLNVPKNIFIAGTGLSWWVGIVYFNSDLIFTVTNVVSHGIPYFALVWSRGRQDLKNNEELNKTYFKYFFSSYSLPIFLGILFLLSFFEEGIWAELVWRENLSFFQPFSFLPVITNHNILTWIVPILALPQMTHYVLDGFIWRNKK
jgi:hypothetical protein